MSKDKLPLWIEIDVPMTRQEMRKVFGPRCRTHAEGCATCDGWKMWDATGKGPMLFEREELVAYQASPVIFRRTR